MLPEDATDSCSGCATGASVEELMAAFPNITFTFESAAGDDATGEGFLSSRVCPAAQLRSAGLSTCFARQLE